MSSRVALADSHSVEKALRPEDLRRFDVHQRLQHFLMLSSFVVCVATGWPLRAYDLGTSPDLVAAMGGPETCGLVHRIAAVAMIFASLYHLFYAIVKIVQRKISWAVLPSPKDVFDLAHNLSFFFGLSKTRPRFGKFTYYEKFDYWAVFWGIFIMGGSGLILWFPVLAARVLPAWAIPIAQIAHGDEALLAALAIFAWHFYNVHMRPGVFPMSWVWLTGRLSPREMVEYHGGQVDDILAARARGSEAASPAAEEDKE